MKVFIKKIFEFIIFVINLTTVGLAGSTLAAEKMLGFLITNESISFTLETHFLEFLGDVVLGHDESLLLELKKF